MSAEKQKRYRERKKKDEFLGNAYCVTKCMELAKVLNREAETWDLLDYSYDIGGQILVERVSFLVYSGFSLIDGLRVSRPGLIRE